MRAETRSELEAIIPFDAAEAEHRTAALTWLDADYEINKPNGASVVSIEDHGVMELQLFLKRA